MTDKLRGADRMNATDKPKCTAADGKTEVHNLPGVGLVVSAAAFNALVRDAERLDWMIFHSAKVRHSSDGEFCTVTWYDDEGQAHETKPFGSARQAIDAAMEENQS